MRCNTILAVLIVFTFYACKEITDFYYVGKVNRYARPIGLMMSNQFDTLNLSGKNVTIGVIDAGFGQFKSNNYTRELDVMDYRDFIDNDTVGFFSENESDHGTIVCKNIGGRNINNEVFGLAYQANYILAKTESVDIENEDDELRLIEGVKWLVSKNVDIINLSVGYTNFLEGIQYDNTQLDGKTSRSSRFIDSLLQVHPKLIIVASAGNEGNNEWKHIIFPSDVREVITVGACDFDGNTNADFSGIGVDYVDYIKPDVVTYPVPQGNSSTAPVITGLIANILEYRKVDRKTVIKLLHQSGSNSNKPSQYTGYGIPSCKKLVKIFNNLNAE